MPRIAVAAVGPKVVLLFLLGFIALGGFAGTPGTLEYRLHREIDTPTFTVAGFLVGELPRALRAGPSAQAAVAGGEEVVRRYLAAVRRAATQQRPADSAPPGTAREPDTRAAAQEASRALETLAERALAVQVAAVLRVEGLGLGGGDVFPPVRFVFRDPPLVLVVSPRDSIALREAAPLADSLDEAAQARVEERAERLGLSALVVRIGGLATYPAMLPPRDDLDGLVEAVAHEWAHNYFTLRPLGWRYALGLERDPAVIAINETAADLIGRDVGRRVLEEFYGQKLAPEPATGGAPDPRVARFRSRMRQIRASVDELLAGGQVVAAERLMEEQRQALGREGFGLRKLNQAYFAFHGSYAEGPAGRLDPVLADVKALRARSPSLRAFAEAVSGVTSAAELRALAVR